MKQSQLITLLLVASCVAIAAAKPVLRPMFADWMDQQSAEAAGISAKIAADSEYEYGYPAVEHEVVCLKEAKTANCRCNAEECGVNATSCCTSQYHESFLSCCTTPQEEGNYYYGDEDDVGYGYGPDGMPSEPSPIPIGSCDTKAHIFPHPIGSQGCDKIGTFTKICNIAHGSLCGAPFCDGLMFKQEGAIYRTWAISKTDPSAPVDECDGNGAAIPAKIAGSYGSYQPPAPPASTPPPTPTGPPPCSSTKKYFKSIADIWTGPITVYSRKHHFKYHFGTAEYAFWHKENVTCVSESKHMPFVNPFTYTLKLDKPVVDLKY